MNGVQITGLANLAGGTMRGVQIAGVSNISGNNTVGLSAAGLVNITGDGSKAVSYTHLDVYKRQLPDRSTRYLFYSDLPYLIYLSLIHI